MSLRSKLTAYLESQRQLTQAREDFYEAIVEAHESMTIKELTQTTGLSAARICQIFKRQKERA